MPRHYKELFLYQLILTAFFFLLEISFFIQYSKGYLVDFSFVSSHLHIPLTIVPGVLFFIFAQLSIHLFFCVSIWLITLIISTSFKLPANRTVTLGITLWVAGIVTLLTLNQIFYPNSRFAILTSMILFDHRLVSVLSTLIMLLWLCVGITILFWLYNQARYLYQYAKSNPNSTLIYNLKMAAMLLMLSSIVALKLQPQQTITRDGATSERPNIIIIGIDSLRPDYLGYFGSKLSTPFFDTFLNQSTVFNEAVTPLARTFPSWVGILTGQYPKETQMRFNLARQDHLDTSQTLPAILRKHGYATLFATDETRFSNIDESFGFDQAVTPPIGLNDFLLGTFNDFPLSNLIVNTALGKWLFPYTYGNRPVYVSYDPDSFLKMVQPALRRDRTKPLFFAIHFCLPHFPYLWSGLPGDDYSVRERYDLAVQRVDKQASDLFVMLQQSHLLDHAIVILLSDHGEALELSGDRITEPALFQQASSDKKPIPAFYPPSADDETMEQSAGHGTDVLGLSQYHSVLAFQLFGMKQQTGVVPGVVTLLDIKPTILDLLKLPPKPARSFSLAENITGSRTKAPIHKNVFLESDFSPAAIRTIYPETREVLLEGIKIFQVDPATTRLYVKDDMGKMIIRSKQFAAISGEWMLALYPQTNLQYTPILVNLKTGKWTNDLQSPFGLRSPAKRMLSDLKSFYGDDIH